jgi:hypothetical protein
VLCFEIDLLGILLLLTDWVLLGFVLEKFGYGREA